MKKLTIATKEDKYIVAFNINTLIDLEEELGGFDKLGENVGLKELRAIFYHGLRKFQKDITIKEAGEVMSEVVDEKGLEDFVNEITGALTEAINGSPSTK